MNNDISNYIDDGIGTDPTIVPIIESLDDKQVEVNVKNDKVETEKKVKNSDGVKNTIFIIITILLIGGVGYGVYYYLSLASNKSTFILNNINVEVDSALSSNVGDYGTFSSSIISSCVLNTESVNTNIAGTYSYSVTCNNETKTAFITVSDSTN